MKKIKYLVSALLMGAVIVNANPVTLNNAQKVAANFYNRTFNTNATSQTLVYTERSSDGQPVYYVFDINNNAGFVMVSAEDATVPVLGYSNEGSFVAPGAGNNVDFWMTQRKNEISTIRAKGITATSDIADEWNAYINNTQLRNTHSIMSSVNPLCVTTWDQPAPYNEYCPHGSLTGCVATAMAQIMKYWAYPKVGLSSSCYQDEIADGFQENYGQLCEYYDTSHYAWTSMPNNVTSTNHEVGKLMVDCGVSVNMDYSPNGSGAAVVGSAPSAQNSYVQYFNYDAITIQEIDYDNFTESQWNSLLEIELNNKRPVQYQGTDATYGGHSWVCDGYNTSGDFHMNWGWSGQDDGYFTVTTLNPSPYDFKLDVAAIIGIQPPPLSVENVSNTVEINVYPNPSHGTFTFEVPTDVKNAQLKVYSTEGQEIYSSIMNSGNNSIYIGNQPVGIYLYRLINDNGQQVSTGKLIIQ
jgi:hypothetical protein